MRPHLIFFAGAMLMGAEMTAQAAVQQVPAAAPGTMAAPGAPGTTTTTTESSTTSRYDSRGNPDTDQQSATDGTAATSPTQTGTYDRDQDTRGSYGTNGQATGIGNGTATNTGENNSLSPETQTPEQRDNQAATQYREHWWQFWRDERPAPIMNQ